jgi:DeoR/GlpR family transcriptional regulator of sugar metabolism
VITAERRLALTDLIEEQAVFTVESLAHRFGISTQTVRRDLRALEGQGLLRRTYGGAVVRGVASSPELAFHTREEAYRPQKEAIARATLRLLTPGQTVMFDASSTVLHLARLLPADFEGTAVVNALPIAFELGRKTKLNVTFLGGTLRRSSLSFVGPLAESALRKLYVDTALISAKGCSASHGLTEANPYEAQLKEYVVTRSKTVLALVDSSKLERAALVQFGAADCVHTLITDWGARPEAVEALRQAGVTVVIAEDPAEHWRTG